MSKQFELGRLKAMLLFEFPEHEAKQKIRKIFNKFGENDCITTVDNKLKDFTENERLDIYHKVYHLFGYNQLIVAIEEMSELIQSISHVIRDDRDITYNSMASEIADVRIMVDQLINIFSIYDLVVDHEKKKLQRLNNYLKEVGYEESETN